MPTSEPFATALLLAIAGLLMGASVLFSRASNRIGVPIVLLFLCIGMLAGSEGLGRIDFEDYGFAFRLGSLALALILFDGGLNTPLAALRRTWAPAGMLATVGVALTALLDRAAGPLLGALVAGRRWCWARSCRPPTRPRCSPCSAAAGSSSSAGWAPRSSSSRASTIPSPSSSPPRSPRTCCTRASSPPGGSCSRCCSSSPSAARSAWASGSAAAWLLRRYPLPTGGLYPALTLALRAAGVRGHDAGARKRIPGGVPGGDGARQRSPALPQRIAPGARRAGLAGADRDVPHPRAAGVPEPAARGGAHRARPGDSLGVRGAAAGGGALPGVVPVPVARGGIHRMGGAPGRRADRAGDLPGAGGGAGRGPDLPRGVLHRRGERARAGGDGGVGDPAAGAAEGGSAGAAGGAGDRVAAAAGRRADVVLRGRGAGGDGSVAQRIWSSRRGRA